MLGAGDLMEIQWRLMWPSHPVHIFVTCLNTDNMGLAPGRSKAENVLPCCEGLSVELLETFVVDRPRTDP